MAKQRRKKRPFTRTTTGCLTCRSRHIKCDEAYLQRGRERPSPCFNCQRVNRDCVRRPAECLVVYSSVAGNGTFDESEGAMDDNTDTENRCSMLGQSRASHDFNASDEAEEDHARLDAGTDQQLSHSLNTSAGSKVDTPSHCPPGSTPEVLQAERTENLSSHRSDGSGGPARATRCLSTSTVPLDHARSPSGTYRRSYSEYQFTSLGTSHLGTSHDPVHQTASGGYENNAVILSIPSLPSLSPESVRTFFPEECLNGSLPYLDPNDPEIFRCLHHYVTQIGPSNDLWDDQQRFSRLLPREAPSCQPLLAACVAMGAKHLYLTATYDRDRVIQFYNDAIHRLMPVLQVASNSASSESWSGTPGCTDGQILATLLIMAQYEMSSHSNRTFRDHLNGASRYIDHHNLRPGPGAGLLEAAFITYARLDAYAAYINLDETGIEPSACHVPTRQDCISDEAWANKLLVIFADIVNLRSRCWKSASRPDIDKWLHLSDRLTRWLEKAPASFKPLLVGKGSKDTIPPMWYVSSAIISALQTYHSSWILLLYLKPVSGDILDAYRAIEPQTLFHARQIISIARTSRTDIRSIVNGVQACHIAGRVLKLEEERQVVVQLLTEAEDRTGWATRWRVDALKTEWG